MNAVNAVVPTPLEPVDWPAAQVALRSATSRVAALVRSLDNPGAPAVGEWVAGDTAVHLCHAWEAVGGIALGEVQSFIGDVWELPGLTAGLVRGDDGRDMSVLADRIEAKAGQVLDYLAGAQTDEERPWFVEGTKVRLSTLTCHLLNESLVHGWDIAHAVGRDWPIDRADAALVLQGFLCPIANLLGSGLVDQKKAAGVHACYDIRLRGGGRAFFVFDDGFLTVEGPSARRVDCHLSADPTALLLVAWDRQSQWPAIAKGKLMAWGRRPWLGIQLRSFMRNP
jgi:hypothetical protein